jgi:hypothetical protein
VLVPDAISLRKNIGEVGKFANGPDAICNAGGNFLRKNNHPQRSVDKIVDSMDYYPISHELIRDRTLINTTKTTTTKIDRRFASLTTILEDIGVAKAGK